MEAACVHVDKIVVLGRVETTLSGKVSDVTEHVAPETLAHSTQELVVLTWPRESSEKMDHVTTMPFAKTSRSSRGATPLYLAWTRLESTSVPYDFDLM